jgi:hypothetical protein
MQHPNNPSSAKPLSAIEHQWERVARGVVCSQCNTDMVPGAGLGFGTHRIHNKESIGTMARQMSIFYNCFTIMINSSTVGAI